MNASFYSYIGIVSKNLGEDLFKIFEALIAVYAGVQLAKRAASGIKALRKQVDDLFEGNREKIGDIGRSNRLYTDKVTRKKFDDDLAPAGIKELELVFKDGKIERGMLFDNDGNLLSDVIEGTEDFFPLSKTVVKDAKKELERLGKKTSDLSVTHNHPPPGSSLSFEDVGLTIRHNLKSIRAINFDGTIFELKRVGTYPSEFDFLRDLNNLLKARHPKLKRNDSNYSLTLADLAIEILGKNIEYTHYIN